MFTSFSGGSRLSIVGSSLWSEDSFGREEGSWLTSFVMKDFSPTCSEIQHDRELSKSPMSSLPDINYMLRIKGKRLILTE